MRTAILLVAALLSAGCASRVALHPGASLAERSPVTGASLGAGELSLDIAELI